ncbi:MAG: N-acetylmuramic acid 6-phosphate etherase [Pyrinomonadaceae bacterium]
MNRITEKENPASTEIDRLSTRRALEIINAEDQKVAKAVAESIADIALCVDRISERLSKGGRLFYVGTGTSGRLGVLDASELPPTFGVPYEMVQGLIAGGYDALHRAVEASEDDFNLGAADLTDRNLNANDCVIGIAASGTTPYTIGAVSHARKMGCFTACITCNPGAPITEAAEVPIVVVVGPEVLTGSTRMKSGTAQKLVLNMISTMVMIRLGYVAGNRMTNVRAANKKLVERSVRILMAETGLEIEEAKELFAKSDNELRKAIVMHSCGVSADIAAAALAASDFVVKKAIQKIQSDGERI